MRTLDFDYELPEVLIAQTPPPKREDARLLVLERATGRLEHGGIRDLPERLRSGDLLVLNDTRVLPARLAARRATGGRVEVLLLEPEADAWTALVRAGGTLRAGERLAVGTAQIELLADLGQGIFRVRGVGVDCRDLAHAAGAMPLPPYIRRDDADPAVADLDRARYQTVFAREEGAVAAPTAGLHFTDALLARLERRGVERAFVTLHVGLGTFAQVRSDSLDDHVMHAERYAIPAATARAVARARSEGRRVVAVGTTTVRALEGAAAASGGLPAAGPGRTALMILPGHRFQVVDALLTNFHLPRSTLLALVAALAGREPVLAAYREAVARRYRFYSYGDAMLIT